MWGWERGATLRPPPPEHTHWALVRSGTSGTCRVASGVLSACRGDESGHSGALGAKASNGSTSAQAPRVARQVPLELEALEDVSSPPPYCQSLERCKVEAGCTLPCSVVPMASARRQQSGKLAQSNSVFIPSRPRQRRHHRRPIWATDRSSFEEREAGRSR